jgi:small GTP-binding protein
MYKQYKSVWDTAGQEKYKTIPAQYFRGVQGILFVYDITDAESFLRVRDWLDKAADNADGTLIGMSLVGNKLDMEDSRQVKFQDALAFAKQQGVPVRLCRWG